VRLRASSRLSSNSKTANINHNRNLDPKLDPPSPPAAAAASSIIKVFIKVLKFEVHTTNLIISIPIRSMLRRSITSGQPNLNFAL
jgi:hypothetical protein